VKALVFAAGLGERMRPLTTHTPKPLLDVGGKPLVAWHLEKLAACGVREVVINTSWLAEQFPPALGDGAAFGLRIVYSYEGEAPLDTGGGMQAARALLGEAPFLLVNADVWTDYDFARLPREPRGLAHLVMVDVPAQARHGDFALDADGTLHAGGDGLLTYAGIGVYRAALLDVMPRAERRFSIVPRLRAAMALAAVSGEHHRGAWTDVGTPERLHQLRASP
jgi:MurNAc alpha-1-phosphate uridylyltransferase